ncbi:zinc finger, CCHC-type containing protein [Tanacetum coccineum]
MHFLLTTLKVVYVLTTPMPKLMENDTVEAIRRRSKLENDDYICRGHILNGMFDSLFDIYQNVESAKKLWGSLESKYMAEDASIKKFLVSNFNNYKMVDSRNDKGKGKEVVGPSVNMTEEGGKNKHHTKNKGKKRSNEKNSGSSSNKKPKLECWKCGKTGHFKRDYCSGKKNNVNAGGSGKRSKDQSQDQGQNLVPVWNRFIKYYVSLISKAFYVQVDAITWWIDSGATTHVCKDHCWFKTYEPMQDGSVLYMGDDHFAPIHGKGRFGYYNNGMFMLNLNKVPDDSDSVYMSSSTVVNSSSWHARLGHVHYKRMLEMSKDDLIHAIDENQEKYKGGEYYDPVFFKSVGIIHETTAPYTPQQNGMAKRKNRALKEMVNSMLSYSGLSEGFWGEAMLTACYLLNMVPNKRNKTTPYELWDDHSDDVPSEILKPHKGKRVRKAKSYGLDFQLYLVEGSRDQVGSQYSYCYSIEEDPRTYDEAMQYRDAAF